MQKPTSLCECGCGEPAPIATATARSAGWVKGQPKRFVNGHFSRMRSQRLLALYLPTDGPSDACWEWRGRRNRRGYGIGLRRGQAHRIAYEVANGPIPDGMHVCHTCDNPPCCNPAHLFLGSAADNMADMARKERSGVMKLSAAEAREVRRRRSLGEPLSSMAAEFGVTKQTISAIALGKKRPHV